MLVSGRVSETFHLFHTPGMEYETALRPLIYFVAKETCGENLIQ